jgi:hypothetical protein
VRASTPIRSRASFAKHWYYSPFKLSGSCPYRDFEGSGEGLANYARSRPFVGGRSRSWWQVDFHNLRIAFSLNERDADSRSVRVVAMPGPPPHTEGGLGGSWGKTALPPCPRSGKIARRAALPALESEGGAGCLIERQCKLIERLTKLWNAVQIEVHRGLIPPRNACC